MASLRVDVVRIQDIEAHPNADRLDVAYPFGKGGWAVVVGKGRYKIGDLVIYCPVDCILPPGLEDRLFPIGSAIKLNRSRIRAIRIRGFVSQGMIIDPNDVAVEVPSELLVQGEDMAERLSITKYEPPASSVPNHMRIQQQKKVKPDIKAFKKYTDVEHGKYWTREMRPGDEIVVTTKLHGTSFRAGWFKSEANTWWQKVLKFFWLLPEWTFAWGSRNMQIQAKWLKHHPGMKIDDQGVNFGDVYTKMVNQYDLRNRIPKGTAVYGEIVGDGIQKDYRYGCKAGEHKLYLYDIMKDGEWMDYTGEYNFFKEALVMGLETVPWLFVGPYEEGVIEKFLDVNPLSDEINEGVVVRFSKETSRPHIGRVIFKWISDGYYMIRNGTDFH